MGHLTVILVLAAVLSKDVLAKKVHHKHHPKSNGGKIVGGNEVSIEDYPYQASLIVKVGEDDYFGCGGAIISTYFILSAAHCFKEAISARARIGSNERYSGGKNYKGTFEVHPDFEPLSLDYDIAVLKTEEEMTLDGVHSKAVPVVEGGMIIPSGSMVKISGWGDTSEGGRDSRTLRAVELPTWSNEECNENQYVTERQFCVGLKEGGKDSCQGDSGGPIVLVETGVLVGVVSGGYGCARPNSPGAHTNITNLREWVKEKTGL